MAKTARKKPSYADGDIVTPYSDKKAKQSANQREPGTAAHCLDEIDAYERVYSKWEKRAKTIVERYRDERDSIGDTRRRFNILWSNVQVLRPTLYARAPKAEVIRRFKDKDQVARIGAEIAERALDVEIERSGFHEAMKMAVDDRLLSGRGQVWIAYKPTFEGEGEAKQKTDDSLTPIYVDWRDFGHTVARTWEEIQDRGKVWRRVYMDKDEVKSRKWDWQKWIDKLEFTDRKEKTNEEDAVKQACFYEVWDAKNKRVYWANKNVPDYLDEYDDPLKLEGFFPCPKPLYSTTTNDTLVPVPDFALYQDQANEIDKITQSITRLTDGLKIVGVYDQDLEALKTLLDPGGIAHNTMVPVKMTDLTGKGGLDGAVQFLPLEEVITALQTAYVAREQAVQAIYDITGISDVMRGATTQKNETATEQQLKANFGGTRIKDMQANVARFSRDCLRIMGEIIVENYDPSTLWRMTNAETFIGMKEQQPPQPGMPPQPPEPNVDLFVEALGLLKDDRLRSYRVDIETDSTIALDEAESKQEAVEFMKVIGEAIAGALPIVSQIPQSIQFFTESLLFTARRFKAGRTLEGSLETMMEQLAQAAQQPKQDPEMMKVQGEMQIMQEKMKLMQMQAQIKAAEGQQKLQLERELAQLEIQIKAMELQMEQRKSEMELQADQAKHRQEMVQMHQRGQIESRLAQQQGQQQLRMGEQKAQQQKQIGDQKVAQARSLAKAKPANARTA